MYDNAQAALFDDHERWVVVIGHGAWVIRLPLVAGLTADKAPSFNVRETLAGKAQAFADAPFVCLMNDIAGNFWPETICWADTADGHTLRLIGGWNEQDAGIFDLSLETLTIKKRASILPVKESDNAKPPQ